MGKKRSFTLQDLADETGVEPRTIRSWIEKGLLPGASGRGPEASYGWKHLNRIRAVLVFKDSYRLTLDEIRQALLRLDNDAIAAIAHDAVEPTQLDLWARGAESDPSRRADDGGALGYVRALLRPSPRGTADTGAPSPARAFARPRGTAPPLGRAGSPGSAGSRLERLAETLARLARKLPRPKARTEWWASVSITPDLELRARGLDSADIPHLEQVADLLRLLIQEGTHR